MGSLPFDGLTVLEYAGFIAGPYCAKLLADLGARVVKIEPPGAGDPARSYGPFPGDIPDKEKSGLFLYLSSNKLSVTLDPKTPAGRDLFTRLASKAGLLVEDTEPGTMAELGLDYATLREANPGLVYVSITPYGQNGPKAHWKAHHINTFHAAGEGYALPGGLSHATFPDRAPITGGAHMGEYDAALMAASAAVAALFAREAWGLGQHVDVSKQEATLAVNRLAQALYLGHGVISDKSRHYDYGGLYPCKDGYVNLFPREDHQWQALTEVMGRPDLAESEIFRARAARIEHGDEVNAIVAGWAATLTKSEIYQRVAPTRCPASPFATPEEVVNSPQMEARRFFLEVHHPKVGTLQHPSQPYRFSVSQDTQRRPAPLLGQHNEEVLCGDLGLEPEELAGLRRGGVV